MNIYSQAKRIQWKKQKMNKKKVSLFYLLNDVFLILLQYCEKDGIKATRAYQSEWVQVCTENTSMVDAA